MDAHCTFGHPRSGRGDGVVVLEALKMASTIAATRAGIVEKTEHGPSDHGQFDVVLALIS